MPSVPCPNEEECGGFIKVHVRPDYDTNATDFEIISKDCDCELTDEQWNEVCQAAYDWEPSYF